MPDDTGDKARRPGRPRSARADRAILQATVELLVETGFGRMSIEAIAARAQVGKATIYRRWSSKGEIVTEALRNMTDDVRMPDSGNTRDDLIALLHDFRRVTGTSVVGTMIGRVMSAAIGNPEFMQIFWTNTILPRRKAVKAILQRGQRRGEVRADLNLEIVLDMFPGTMMYRSLVSRHGLGQVETIAPEELVNTIWAGISTDGKVPERRKPRC